MIWALGWYITMLALAALVWPLAGRLFGRLPDRGYSVTKPLGWLAVGYGYWLLVRFGLLPNARGTLLLIGIAIALATIFLARPAVLEAIAWPRQQWRYLVLSEAIFLIGFALMLALRAFNPEISATEKPMEFAFLNGSLASPAFPPQDPWLSGQTISYYYFGYILTGALVLLTGVESAIGFNLALALLFGLAAQAVFGLAYNLNLVGRPLNPARLERGGLVAGGAAALFLLVTGNLEGGFEFLHSRGFGTPEFWQKVGIDGIGPPYVSTTWFPTDNWFWWRATRVINTLVDGKGQDYTISEFPFFSFLLGDLHPHVLALPFALLAVSLALDQFLDRAGGPRRWISARSAAAALIIGSLGFLNSWDFPTYLALFIAAAIAGQYLQRPKLDRALGLAVARLAAPTAALGVLFYLPFYLGFRSQASGIGLVGRYGAQFHHWLIFWGALLFPTISLLIVSLARPGRSRRPRWWAPVVALAPIAIWLAAQFTIGGGQPPVTTWLGSKLVLLLPMAGFALLAWWAFDRRLAIEGQAGHHDPEPGGTGLAFVLLMTGFAASLILGAELFFIRDVFNTRMNTVFKLFYQAWILLAVVSGFGLYYCFRAIPALAPAAARAPLRVAWSIPLALVALVALYYPAAAAANRSLGDGRGPTLDGLAFARKAEPAEVAAQEWVRHSTPGNAVILEAIGGQYSEFARVATRTGRPTVLGWPGHEAQWRGSDALYRGREAEVEEIYRNVDRTRVLALLKKYHVQYVYVGRLERAKYGAVLGRFDEYLPVAFQQGGVTIYRVP